jgi:hypothetical protein
METTNRDAAWAAAALSALLRNAVQALLVAQLASLGVKPKP